MVTDRRAQTVEAADDALGPRFGEWMELLRRLHRWLKPGGVFIAPMKTAFLWVLARKPA